MPVCATLLTWTKRKVRWRAVGVITGNAVRVHVERFTMHTDDDDETGWCPVDEYGEVCDDPYFVAQALVKVGDTATVEELAQAAVDFVEEWARRNEPEEELAAFCEEAAKSVQRELDG